MEIEATDRYRPLTKAENRLRPLTKKLTRRDKNNYKKNKDNETKGDCDYGEDIGGAFGWR